MKDQVETAGTKEIPALSIHSGMNFIEVRKTLETAIHGTYKFLYSVAGKAHNPFV